MSINSIKNALKTIKIYMGCELKSRNALGLSFHTYALSHKCNHLTRYKHINDGKKCFIVGTGPSLKIEDLELLKGQTCIGVNTLFKVYNQTEWRPSYYCIIDPNTYGNIKNELVDNDVKNIFIAQNRIQESLNDDRFIPFNLDCSSFYRIHSKNHLEKMRFSYDIEKKVYDGASVVFAAIQIAMYMGYTEIYLLGTDCNYDTQILHGESLGYSRDYQYNWTKQTGLTMIEGFKVAKKYADCRNVHIYNATRGGMLEVFPRVRLEEAVKG